MKRKATVASVVLSAALVLAACSSPETEADPLAPLTNGSTVSNNSTGNGGGNEEDTVSAEEALEGSDRVAPAVEDTVTDPADISSGDPVTEEDVDAHWDEVDYFGINPEEVNVPDSVVEHFSEEPELTDTSRVVRDALYAANYGMMNTTFQTQKLEGDLIDSYIDYLGEILTSEAADKLDRSLLNEGDETPWSAWYLAPYRSSAEVFWTGKDFSPIASSDLNWHSEISDVQVVMPILSEGGAVRDGVLVSMHREYYVPIEDGSQAAAMAMRFNLIMVPDGYGKWIVSDWFTSGISDTVLVDVEN